MNPSLLVDHEPGAAPGTHVVRALLRIDGTPPAARTRVPLNLAVVLDRSGSMAGEKLAFASEAARGLLARVFPEDATSVVAFGSDVDVVVPAAPRGQQADLPARIAAIRPGGCTNLSGGWLEGRRQLERNLRPDACNRVVLMTDGLANQGITDPDDLARLLAQAKAGGVTTSTIGFGRDFDERLLTDLADAGGGNTHYIEHPDQAPAIFASELTDLLALSAQNLVAEVRIAPGVRLAAVHHSYPRAEREGGVLELRLGDLYASEPKELLLELVVAPSDAASVEVASLTVSGAVREADGGLVLREIALPIRYSPAEGPIVNPEVRRALVLLAAAAARRDALGHERLGRTREGARMLREAALRVREVGDDAELLEEAADLERTARAMAEQAFSPEDRKYTAQREYYRARSKGGKAELLSRVRRERDADG